MGVFDLKSYKLLKAQQKLVITTRSLFSMGVELAAVAAAAPSSQAWLVANRATYIPFNLPVDGIVQHLAVQNGAAVSGNINIGIYDAALARIVSSGSTPQAGTNQVQSFNITDTFLKAG